MPQSDQKNSIVRHSKICFAMSHLGHSRPDRASSRSGHVGCAPKAEVKSEYRRPNELYRDTAIKKTRMLRADFAVRAVAGKFQSLMIRSGSSLTVPDWALPACMAGRRRTLIVGILATSPSDWGAFFPRCHEMLSRAVNQVTHSLRQWRPRLLMRHKQRAAGGLHLLSRRARPL